MRVVLVGSPLSNQGAQDVRYNQASAPTISTTPANCSRQLDRTVTLPDVRTAIPLSATALPIGIDEHPPTSNRHEQAMPQPSDLQNPAGAKGLLGFERWDLSGDQFGAVARLS